MKANVGIASCVLASAVFFSASNVRAADHANGFGEKGELIVTADRLVPVFSWSYGTVSRTTNNNVELTTSSSGGGISLLFGRNPTRSEDGRVPVNVHTLPRVAFDVTVIRSLTVGAGLAFGFGLGGTNKDETEANGNKVSRSTDAPTATAIGVTPRVGYIFALNNVFAFWPRVGLGIYSISGSTEDTPTPGTTVTTTRTDTLFSLDLDPQFAIVPLEHFFIHVGPIVNVPLGGSRSTTTVTRTDTPKTETTREDSADASMFNIGISAGLGGWFNVF